MISKLQLRNFKCFADQEIRFAPLTMLVGANAAGKSSAIQSLLLLRQSDDAEMLAHGALLLRGDLTNVGTQSEVFLRDRADDRLALVLTSDSGVEHFSFNFDMGSANDYILKGPAQGSWTRSNLFTQPMNYLNAERIGPRLTYPIGSDSGWAYNVGAQGQYAAAILGRYRESPIQNSISGAMATPETATAPVPDPDAPLVLDEAGGSTLAVGAPQPAAPFRTLEAEVTRWMQEIVPGFEFSARIIEQTDQAILLMRTNPAENFVRPTNIGFGLIYTLPIVVAALVAPTGSLLIVENPEAHLHPRSQSAMGKFLARVAAAGVQVVVETHSDHVLNGIRVAVRQGAWGAPLAADDVSIQYFVAADSEGPQRVITPRLYPSGGISPRPDGFFDQIDLDLMELL